MGLPALKTAASSWWTTLGLSAVLIVLPGPDRSPLSGLPLASKATLVLCALIILAVFTALFRPRSTPRPIYNALLVAAIAAKVIFAAWLLPGGWRGEYTTAQFSTDLGWLQPKRVYFSNPLPQPFRIDRQIAFRGMNFGLFYVNDRQATFPDLTMKPRDVFQPLVVRWTGHILTTEPGALTFNVESVGSVTIKVDGEPVFRATDAKPQNITTPNLDAGPHVIVVEYSKRPDVTPAITVVPGARVMATPATAEQIQRSDWANRAIHTAGAIALIALLLAFIEAFGPMSRFFLEEIWVSPDRLLAGVIAAGFIVTAVYAAIPINHATVHLGIGDDPHIYEGNARLILRNGLLMVGNDRPRELAYYHYPLYAYSLAAAHFIFGEDFGAVLLLNYFCLAAATLLLWRILRTRLTTGAMVIVLGVFVLFARRNLIAYARWPFSDNLYIPAVLLLLLVSIRLFQRPSRRLAFIVGIITALGAATRPSLMLHVPVLSLVILMNRSFGDLKRRLSNIGSFIGGFLLGVSPFTLRNWIVTGTFVLLVSSFIMLPFFLYPPGAQVPNFYVNGRPPTLTQSVGQFFSVYASDPVGVTLLEIKKVLFTLGFTTIFGPQPDTTPRHLVIYPILFGFALLAKRVDPPLRAALLTFCASHTIASVIAGPWTYGYKTIVPFQLACLIGGALLLPRRQFFEERRITEVMSSLTSRRVSVVLPTYNEKDSIRAVIEQFKATGVVDEILVINNNAVAGTSEEVAGTGAREIFEARQGYGAAIQRGLAEASGELIVVCEPDGTFLARDIHKLLAYAQDFDVVYGSRTSQQLIWRGANMGLFLRWGNWVVAKYLQFLYNATSLTDVGCTMRLLRKEVASSLAGQFRIQGSQFGPEMMILSLRDGYRVIQVPVNYIARVGVSSVTGDPAKAFLLGLQMIWLITARRFEHLFVTRPAQEDSTAARSSESAT